MAAFVPAGTQFRGFVVPLRGPALVCGRIGRVPVVPRLAVSRRTRTTRMMFDQLSEKLDETLRKLKGQDRMTEKNIETAVKDLRRALLDADVNLKVVNALVKVVKERAIGEEVIKGVKPGQQLVKVMHEELTRTMGEKQASLARRQGKGPTVILLSGLQGAGKTTAAAKLALYCKKEDKPQKVLLVAADVYRPAAIEQLQTLGKQIDTPVYSLGRDKSPVTIAKEAINSAKVQGFDTVIIDTAGRQVIDENLMKELKNIKDVSNPDEVLLVVDAMTGQEAANLTKAFNDAVGITGAILTKMDGDTRGGAALSVQQVSGQPIKFIGVGEKVEKLDVFYPERMASRILGMGDVLSFVEKAQEKMDEKKATEMTQKMMDRSFNFQDFIDQAKVVTSLGSLGGIMKMMPGVPKVKQSELQQAERRLKKSTVMIDSMTPKERKNPELLISDRTASSRLRRIAKGSGHSFDEAKDLVTDFKRMRETMARMSNQMLAKGEDGSLQQRQPGDPGTGGNRAARRKKKRTSSDSDTKSRGFGGFGRR
eukprot:Plantae.Rhodophyta-Purpureofilum_apyrenoidigerum.ctg7188.p1 GENE.Plantae.Rhodophyta-Purpureofilum_apyrenoidigerum.ctg7188~~Plantae.Rhodophyta-Purpureofilum_apyrenoidigerum.ctg7188.p1  ORF type:complete len:537 (+),score=119.97 Plantae.Rhodophyta-Purpureofilum_apyrenoidigerum.ctg7188:89-1699(+)